MSQSDQRQLTAASANQSTTSYPARLANRSAARLFEFDSLCDLVLTARAFICAAIMVGFVERNERKPHSSTALRTIRTRNYP